MSGSSAGAQRGWAVSLKGKKLSACIALGSITGEETLSDEILIKWPGGAAAIPVSESADILTAALNAGIPIPNSCRRADCLQCSAFVVTSDDKTKEVGARIELCQASAARAGVFELSANPYHALTTVKLYPAKVMEVAAVAKDTVLLRLLTPRNQLLDFKGGQYASVVIAPGLARSYSIAGVDASSRLVDFYIRIVPGGQFSGWLTSRAREGEMVRIRAPYGGFCFHGQSAAKTLFVATGTGIVPIFAMLDALEAADIANCGELHVIWGNRDRADLFMLDEIEEVCSGLGGQLTCVFSRESVCRRIRVTDIVGDVDLTEAAVYAAGNPEMVRNIREICHAKGVGPRFVHSDAFTFERSFVGEEA